MPFENFKTRGGNTSDSLVILIRPSGKRDPFIRIEDEQERNIFEIGGSGGVGTRYGDLGTAITQLRVYSPLLTPVAVAGDTTAEQTFTVVGLATNDKLFINKPSHQAGLAIGNVRVSATDTLAITYVNVTAAPIVPASETYQLVAHRS